METRELPASGEIYLKSSIADLDPLFWGDSGEFRVNGFWGEKEVSILIDKIDKVFSQEDGEIWIMRAFILNPEKRIPMVLVHFWEKNKTLYSLTKEDENLTRQKALDDTKN